jgi:hypothetical protein
MPALDKYHHAVRKALEKDGWKITAQNTALEYGGVRLYIDIKAETLLIAQRDQKKIAVEVKSFLEHSTVSAFQDAIGQYLTYQVAFETTEPDRILYLAAPSMIWQPFAKLPFTQAIAKRIQLRVLVFDPITEEVIEWIE